MHHAICSACCLFSFLKRIGKQNTRPPLPRRIHSASGGWVRCGMRTAG
jgi:hypothetical protein